MRNIEHDQLSLPGGNLKQLGECNRRTYQWDELDGTPAHVVPDATEGQDISTEHDQSFEAVTGFDDWLWPASESCDLYPAVSNQPIWSYSPHEMRISPSMPYWATHESTTDPISVQSLPASSQDDSVTIKNGSIPTVNDYTLTSQLLECRHTGDMMYAEEQGQDPRETVGTVANVIKIGSVLQNGKFICDEKGCASLTFGRQAELKRHHTTFHAVNKPKFWCHMPACRRRMSAGGEAFHRKDKLMAHIRSMHPSAQQG
ncbi:hypothetical protein BS50DRAFT_260724 [Corynespora cassiicola Philippines]|uniref:C2H2-type domain-containing protein n=1 Tax=Corynespora cassiicola Philippines TaxID=1448308 RepID=A0A2T2N2K4_CORCC|nr:hypothetical protein BS50DRAFT_260724 [Corynespora cassiicola Philippines]